ncbi:hypothetical protein [Neptuniibacter pectenicola]|uniref:hypothetical protein n=1 Tax=Neptuniibacter pectenicola TaxID=1806669 RepID=UPI0007967BFD|nr:hypothetical protein [Neptuniibacter pectenicola]KXJ57189.1 MAG: hypothetical protein AXW15_13720 [Neptuniibacter sp. Phe_28]
MSTPIPTEGTKVYIRDTGGVDIEIDSHYSISGLDGERAEKDRTTLKDSAEVIALGIKRYGTVTLGVFQAEDDAGLDEVSDAYDDAAPRLITWELPTGTYRQFSALVKSFPFTDGGVDSDYKGDIGLRVSGEVTKGTGFTPAT